MSRKVNAYVKMNAATWDAVDARQRYGVESPEYLAARLAMLRAKLAWLGTLRNGLLDRGPYAITTRDVRDAKRRAEAEIRAVSSRIRRVG